MFKFNGEYWYEAPPLLKRIRQWFVWIGGWEKANAKGWQFYIKDYRPDNKMPKEEVKYHYDIIKNFDPLSPERDEYKKKHFKMVNRIWLTPTPISILGNFFTCHSWGMRFKLPSGYLTITWGNEGKKCYISPNGTPSKAHTWYWGTPREILEVAKKR